MKIAFINKYQNKVERGAETFVCELSDRLSKNNEVKIFTSLDIREILKEKFDVVIPTNGRWQAFLARIVTWLYGGKVVISGQSGPGFDDRMNLYSFPDAFVALTDYQKNWARKINPYIRTVKIPNGVSFENSESRPIDFGLPKPIILSVGALEKNKRHDLTIKAVSKIANASMVIIGKGSQEKNLRKMCENLIPGRFVITSFPHKDVSKVYKSASVFAFPTVPWESFGIVLLEAMKAGLPVVTNDDPIRREIVGEAGFFVDPVDTEKYADTLKIALNENRKEKSLAQAKKFNWDIIAIQYEKLFKDLAK